MFYDFHMDVTLVAAPPWSATKNIGLSIISD